MCGREANHWRATLNTTTYINLRPKEVRAKGSFIRKKKKKEKKENPQHRTSQTFFNQITHAALSILKRRPDATRMILNSYLHLEPTDYKSGAGLIFCSSTMRTYYRRLWTKLGNEAKRKKASSPQQEKGKKGSSMEPSQARLSDEPCCVVTREAFLTCKSRKYQNEDHCPREQKED